MIKETSQFNFGPVTFGVKGTGVFIPSKSFGERFAQLTPDQIKLVNKEAWSMRRKCERVMNRYSNMSQFGASLYDGASFSYYVAEAVCKETWALMGKDAA